MIPANLPRDTTTRSFFESVLPKEHAAVVPADAGSGSVTVRLLGGPSFRLDAAGSSLTVTEVRDGDRAPFMLTVPANMAEHFLADWIGPRTLVPTFEPRGISVATDARLIRRVAMVTGSIELVLEGFPAGVATLKAAVGKRDADDPPDVTVKVQMPAFRAMMSGKLAPDEAIVDGHVTVTGKKLVAMQFALALAPFFRLDSDTVMRGSSFVLFATLTLAAAACHKKVTKDDCTHMLDHYLDMVIASDPALRNLSPAQVTAVREMKRAVKKGEKSYEQVEAQCEKEVSGSEYDCAMKAHIPDEWEACIE